jgi:hypothetical protein
MSLNMSGQDAIEWKAARAAVDSARAALEAAGDARKKATAAADAAGVGYTGARGRDEYFAEREAIRDEQEASEDLLTAVSLLRHAMDRLDL